MNRDENGKLCGDVDYEQVAPLVESHHSGSRWRWSYDHYHADGADL